MHRAPFSACIYGGPEVDRMVFSRTVMEQVSNLSMYVCICTCSVRSCHERGQCVLPCMNADSHAVCRQGSLRTVITVHHQTHSFEQALSQKAWAAGTYIHRSIESVLWVCTYVVATWYDYVRGDSKVPQIASCVLAGIRICKCVNIYTHTYMHRALFSACIYGGPKVDRMMFSRTVMDKMSILSIHTQCAVAMSAVSVF